MNNLPDEVEDIVKLLALFSKYGGYWDINHSEDHNLEIKWCPFIGNNNGGYCEDVFQKRAYSIKDFYNEAVDTINQYLEVKESSWTD